MAKILGFANQKGGVGKTTSCVNLAASLAAIGKKVLLIDLDPQGNATTGSGIDKSELLGSTNALLLGDNAAAECILPTPGGYDIIPANHELTQSELELLSMEQREFRLAQALASIEDQYDYVLIDCPPTLNMLTVNALVAAQGLIIPVQCEFYALEGLTALLNTVAQIQASANPKLEIFGILRTMFDGRTALTTEVSSQLLANFSNKVFSTVIPRNIRLAEAPSYGLPALLYDAAAAGSRAYQALAEEIIER
ncbi:MAG: uncharacterized protein K0S08_282 [Gammaproteobacteria bacterium]|jgi:chromosome partitioning protein|nr:uncharacterized protein [Gammaproteobacteria bacterium]